MFDLVARNPAPSPDPPRARALFVGHAGSPSGFSRVLHSILRHLPRARYDLHHLGINYSGPQTSDVGWTVHPNPKPEETHAESALPELLARLNPRLLFLLDEPWVAALHQDVWERSTNRLQIVYAAIDSDEVAEEDLEALAPLDRLVVFTKFARQIVEEKVASIRCRRPDFAFPPIQIIPHGIESDVFYPLVAGDFAAGRKLARRLLFPGEDLEDAFIVLNANRNQPFKRLDLTLEGFALFARNKPSNVRLCLHTGTARRPRGEPAMVDRLGIRDRVLITMPGHRHPEVPSTRLNEIYNACDVGINTSEGEGWGLISFEHAATGAAQIVPRHSACAELWEGAAAFLEPATEDVVPLCQRRGRTVTPEGVASALEAVYRDSLGRQELSRAAYERARRPDWQWREIARVWDRLFRELLEVKRR